MQPASQLDPELFGSKAAGRQHTHASSLRYLDYHVTTVAEWKQRKLKSEQFADS